MAVGNSVGGAGLDAIAAENAAGIIDIVDLRVTLARGDALFLGVFRGFDVDAIRGTRRRAKEAPDALLQPIFVALQHVNAAVARLQRRRGVWKALRGRLLEHRPKGDLKAFIQRYECLADFSE